MRRLSPLLPLLAAFVPLRLAAANPEEEALRHFRDLAETRNYTLGRPVSPQVTPDGKHVVFLRSLPRDPTLRLFEFDLAANRERELLTPAQLLGGAIVAEATMDLLGLDRLEICPWALREGIILRRLDWFADDA